MERLFTLIGRSAWGVYILHEPVARLLEYTVLRGSHFSSGPTVLVIGFGFIVSRLSQRRPTIRYSSVFFPQRSQRPLVAPVVSAGSTVLSACGVYSAGVAQEPALQHLPNGCFKPPIQRAGQAINDELFGGVSPTDFGTLTFGRQRALGTDAMLLYDPAGGAYSFSFIGYNGLMACGGDTQDTRLDNAVKYRIASGALHFGAMYKFADGDGGCYSAAAAFTAATCAPQRSHNSAYAVDFGGLYGSFSADLVVQHVNQAISVVNPLLGPTSLTQPYQSTTDSINTQPITGANLIGTNNTEYGIVTDNTAVMAAAKYTWERFKFYGGYEHIVQVNPSNPLGIGARAQATIN